MTSTLHETVSSKVAAGERLSLDELQQLASTPDILTLGMLADDARRQLHGTRVTFVRVGLRALDAPAGEAIPPAAREVRLTGVPSSIDRALDAVAAAKSAAGGRIVSGFSLSGLATLSAGAGVGLPALLARLRDAGLGSLAEVPLDRLEHAEAAVDALTAAGFTRVRLTLAGNAGADRVSLLHLAASLQDRAGCVQAVAPLPLQLAAFRPTTGYEDVKMVALARLAAPNIPVVQVDWLRYGPKLAQVALTFGADDLDNVSASDESPDGRRRAPLEEVRRNVEAAGFTPVERDGRFTLISETT